MGEGQSPDLLRKWLTPSPTSFTLPYSETPARAATDLSVLPSSFHSKKLVAHQALSPGLLHSKDLAHCVAAKRC
jgi:hypothetical protein